MAAHAEPLVDSTQPLLVASEMLALSDDRLLFWSATGALQIRRSDGTWSEVVHSNLAQVVDAQADSRDMLLLGWLADGRSATVRLDNQGLELERWLFSDVPQYLLVHGPQRRVVTEDGTRELLEAGKLGEMQPFPRGELRAEARAHSVPRLIAASGIALQCRPEDHSKKVDALGRCERLSAPTWSFEGRFTDPLVCDKWLLLTEGPSYTKLSVRDLASGKRLADLATGQQHPSLRCMGSNTVLVGMRAGLEQRELPTLRMRWQLPLARTESVRDVALTDHLIAYRVRESARLVVLTRPDRSR